jgi:hypothetical protein
MSAITMKDMPPPKTIVLLLGGGTLLLFGAVLSVFTHSRPTTLISGLAIVFGLAMLRFARFLFPSLGRSSVVKSRKTENGSTVRKLEFVVYIVFSLLFVTTISAALLGYFNNILTYSFTTIFIIAIIFWVRRIL